MTRTARPRSFSSRLLLMVGSASAVAVMLVCVLLVPLHFIRERNAAISNLATQAQVISIHSEAALSFGDPEAGEETLAALRALPGVARATLFTEEGETFADYAPRGTVAPAFEPSVLPRRQVGQWLVVTQPVTHNGTRLGTLVIGYDMTPIYSRLWLDVGRTAVAGLASLGVAWLLAVRLQRVLAAPVAELDRVAQVVSEQGDYSVRAAQLADDELGRLTDTFNQMLTRIEQQDAELRRRNQEMEQFVYTVSHDLKSPLVTITGFVGLLREDVQAGRSEDVLESADHLSRAATRMSQLIDDLLQLSRIGRIGNEAAPVDVGALVRELARDLAPRLEQTGARLVIEEPLPPAVADPRRLEQVFDNLIVNAIKYGCQGDDPQITIGGRNADGEVRYFVRDHGQGIAPQYHDRIFRLFQRLDNRQKGTGVGLAIVARIVEAHGGRTWVESSPGAGATFWIALPAASPPDAAMTLLQGKED